MVRPGVEIREGYHIENPNREKASSKATKAVVILLLLVSAGLMTIVLLGGWSKLAGMIPVLVGWILVYLLMAYYVARWNRGVLPLAAAETSGRLSSIGTHSPGWRNWSDARPSKGRGLRAMWVRVPPRVLTAGAIGRRPPGRGRPSWRRRARRRRA